MALLLSLIGIACFIGGGFFLVRLIRARINRTVRETAAKDARKFRDDETIG